MPFWLQILLSVLGGIALLWGALIVALLVHYRRADRSIDWREMARLAPTPSGSSNVWPSTRVCRALPGGGWVAFSSICCYRSTWSPTSSRYSDTSTTRSSSRSGCASPSHTPAWTPLSETGQEHPTGLPRSSRSPKRASSASGGRRRCQHWSATPRGYGIQPPCSRAEAREP